METPNLPAIRALRPAWNKGRIVGQKRPLKPKHVWAIRVRLELAENHRDLALFTGRPRADFEHSTLLLQLSPLCGHSLRARILELTELT